jgi:hypothetical protein
VQVRVAVLVDVALASVSVDEHTRRYTVLIGCRRLARPMNGADRVQLESGAVAGRSSGSALYANIADVVQAGAGQIVGVHIGARIGSPPSE